LSRLSKTPLQINKRGGFFSRWQLTTQVYSELKATIRNVAQHLSGKPWTNRMHRVNKNNS